MLLKRISFPGFQCLGSRPEGGVCFFSHGPAKVGLQVCKMLVFVQFGVWAAGDLLCEQTQLITSLACTLSMCSTGSLVPRLSTHNCTGDWYFFSRDLTYIIACG